MKKLSSEVKTDIYDFINQYLPEFKRDSKEYDGLDITFATNDEGDTWSYQTGDNSYTGGAYGLPHWSVSFIDTETVASELYSDVINQLEDLLSENR